VISSYALTCSHRAEVDNVELRVFEDPQEAIDVYGPMAARILGRDITFKNRNIPTDLQKESQEVVNQRTADLIYKTLMWHYKHLAEPLDKDELAGLAPKSGADGLSEDDNASNTANQHSSSRDRHAQLFWQLVDTELERNAYGGFSTIMRRRAAQGYQFNCVKNKAIVEEDPWLFDLWSWMEGVSTTFCL
jgi:hypothetical protein